MGLTIAQKIIKNHLVEGEMIPGKEIALRDTGDWFADLWEDRPQMPKEKVYLLDEKYAGMSVSEKLAGQVDFYNVDVDDAPELAQQYRVSSVPCLVLLKEGVLADQSVGFRPEAQLTGWIDGNL